jgi:rod shape-determining protein MreC
VAKGLPGARNTRLLLLGLVLAHLLAISRQVDAGGGRSLLETLLFGALSPFQRLAGGTVRGVLDAWDSYLALRDVGEENRRLKERAGELETSLHRLRKEAQEVGALRALLELKESLGLDTVAAEVVARDGVPWFRSLTLNKGSRDGVALNAAVLCPAGVVGRVVAVGPGAARVQLLLDRDSGAGVMIERTRVTAVVSGRVEFAGDPEPREGGPGNAADLLMKYVPTVADVVPGDVVVTSGMDRIYPKGLLVGRVRSLGPPSGLFREVIVAPAAEVDRVERVLVARGAAPPLELTESVRPQEAGK